jgi:hypothetical protein
MHYSPYGRLIYSVELLVICPASLAAAEQGEDATESDRPRPCAVVRHSDNNPVLGVARVGWIDGRAQFNLCNLLRSATPKYVFERIVG